MGLPRARREAGHRPVPQGVLAFRWLAAKSTSHRWMKPDEWNEALWLVSTLSVYHLIDAPVTQSFIPPNSPKTSYLQGF